MAAPAPSRGFALWVALLLLYFLLLPSAAETGLSVSAAPRVSGGVEVSSTAVQAGIFASRQP